MSRFILFAYTHRHLAYCTACETTSSLLTWCTVLHHGHSHVQLLGVHTERRTDTVVTWLQYWQLGDEYCSRYLHRWELFQSIGQARAVAELPGLIDVKVLKNGTLLFTLRSQTIIEKSLWIHLIQFSLKLCKMKVFSAPVFSRETNRKFTLSQSNSLPPIRFPTLS